MPSPARNTLAVIGAGPIGLEAAVAALDRGFDVHVFERGEAGAHPLAWGHVRMFTPWRMNLGKASVEHLRRSGWTAPAPEGLPTGRELAEHYLQPLARLPELKDRIHAAAQVVHVSRSGALKGDTLGSPSRREHPFRLLVRDVGGRENFLHAYSVIDASGVYGNYSWAGDGGIPARSELYLAPQMSYLVDDVLDLQRERYAGKRTMVIGAGASAMTSVAALATLAAEAAGTTVVWVTRAAAGEVCRDMPNETLAERRALHARGRALAGGADPAVIHVGGARVEGLEYNSATHRYRVTLQIGEQPRIEEVDRVLVNTGYGPDNSIYRELQVSECSATRAPKKVADALRASGATDCLSAPAFDVDALVHPEPDFFILGHKSYGRSSHFLLETGYRQVSDVVEWLAKEQGVAVTS